MRSFRETLHAAVGRTVGTKDREDTLKTAPPSKASTHLSHQTPGLVNNIGACFRLDVSRSIQSETTAPENTRKTLSQSNRNMGCRNSGRRHTRDAFTSCAAASLSASLAFMSNVLFSFGHGYSARALTRLLRPQGWTIIGTTRSAEKSMQLTGEGIISLVWPGSDLAEPLSRATHLLISVGPDQDGDPVLNALEDQIAAIAPNIRWAGYLSTTGVYGDHHGGWVDEDTPLTPSTERGERRVRSEERWRMLAARTGLPLHVFRLAGIYGPDRGPFAKIRTGKSQRIIKKNQVFSRIHVDDIAQTLAASIARPDPGAIYNLCDDEAAPPQDVIAYAAGLLGMPVPPAVPIERAEMSRMARSFYAENKRVRNRRIKDELGIDLIYPNYRIGLKALLVEEEPHSSRRDNET